MRVATSKSKNSESFYINYAFINKNGKSTSRIYKKLGTLKELSAELHTDRDGVMAWAKEQAAICTEDMRKEEENVLVSLSPTKQIKIDEQRSFNCGYLFLQSMYSALRFDNITRNIRSRNNYEFDLNAILSDLIYARVLKPSSKNSSYSYAKTLLETPRYGLHDVYRALDVLEKESDYIQAEVYKNSHFIHQRKKSVLYYDCTNYYFEIEQEDGIKTYGKSKENRPNPIVGMGLFMDTDGIPLAFDLHPGNQNEQLTLKPLEKKIIKDYDCAEFIYCSDSGLASKNNKLFNSTNGRSYVITQSLKKLKKEDREIALNPTQYRKIGSKKFIDLRELDESNHEVYESVYYKELPHTIGNQEETIIVTYSPKYRAYQAKIRENQIARANKIIESKAKTKKTHSNPNDPARFIKSTAVTEQGEAAETVISTLNQEVIDKEKQYDGFYAVATDIDDDIQQIIDINKRRWQIEECFRIMKTDFEARPIYLQKEERIKAHFLICFLALLIYRLLEIKLEKKYTADQILDTLREMKVTTLEGYGYTPSYTRTALTDDLHNLVNFHTDRQIIKKAKMKSIISQSKESNTLR